jgi:hypothetical protein
MRGCSPYIRRVALHQGAADPGDLIACVCGLRIALFIVKKGEGVSGNGGGVAGIQTAEIS